MQQRLERGLGLLGADARFQAAVHGDPTEAAAPVFEAVALRGHLGFHHDGDEDLRWIAGLDSIKSGL